VRSLRRERSLLKQLERVPQLPEPRPERRRRWSVAFLIRLVVPGDSR